MHQYQRIFCFFLKSDSRKHNIRSVLTTDIKILSKKSLLKVSQTRETQCAIVNKKSAKKCQYSIF